MRDFLCVIRVSRQWRSARVKKSAWPAFSLETMIQSLRDDDFDNPQRRKLEVAVRAEDHKKLGALLSKAGVMEVWRHVTEIQLLSEGSSWSVLPLPPKQLRASIAALQLLPHFASLAALTLDGLVATSDADSAAIELFNALSSRLLMLGLFRCSVVFGAQLHRLSSLRVLVLGGVPDIDALIPLHQLVYLHMDDLGWDEKENARLGFVIRWLSVHHALRTWSIERFNNHHWLLPMADAFITALMACEPQSLVNAAQLAELNQTLNPPLDPTAPCVLEDLSLHALAATAKSLLNSLPNLTRLQCLAHHRDQFRYLFAAELDPSLQIALTRLEQLRVEGEVGFALWDQLEHCTALRVVHLIQPKHVSRTRKTLTRTVLWSLLSAWSSTLEECTLALEVNLEGVGRQAGNNEWAELAACKRLRIVELKLAPEQALPAELVAALQHLPAFRPLVLSFEGAQMCLLPSNLLSVMCRSPSFSTLHLHARSTGSRAPDFVQSVDAAAGKCLGLSAMLFTLVQSEPALLTTQRLNRIRVVGHYPSKSRPVVRSFQIVQSAEQPPAWTLEY